MKRTVQVTRIVWLPRRFLRFLSPAEPNGEIHPQPSRHAARLPYPGDGENATPAPSGGPTLREEQLKTLDGSYTKEFRERLNDIHGAHRRRSCLKRIACLLQTKSRIIKSLEIVWECSLEPATFRFISMDGCLRFEALVSPRTALEAAPPETPEIKGLAATAKSRPRYGSGARPANLRGQEKPTGREQRKRAPATTVSAGTRQFAASAAAV